MVPSITDVCRINFTNYSVYRGTNEVEENAWFGSLFTE